jgi:quercetin dioxygenase-like cupin family protein
MSALLRILLLTPMVLCAQGATSRELLKTGSTWNGAALTVAALARPEVRTVLVELAPGAATGWHRHPVNNYAYILEGTLKLELEDKTTHVFRQGEAFAEVVATWHQGSNIGSTPLKILVFYTGEAGQPITQVRPAAPER